MFAPVLWCTLCCAQMSCQDVSRYDGPCHMIGTLHALDKQAAFGKWSLLKSLGRQQDLTIRNKCYEPHWQKVFEETDLMSTIDETSSVNVWASVHMWLCSQIIWSRRIWPLLSQHSSAILSLAKKKSPSTLTLKHSKLGQRRPWSLSQKKDTSNRGKGALQVSENDSEKQNIWIE